MWELWTFGELPYAALSNKQVLEQLEKGEYLPKPKNCSEELYQIMLKCWNLEPEERPSFSQLHRHINSLFPDATARPLSANLSQNGNAIQGYDYHAAEGVEYK